MPIEVLDKVWDGLRCPRCGCQRMDVSWIRHRKGGIRRVRICALCHRRIVTVERVIGVVKTTEKSQRKIDIFT